MNKKSVVPLNKQQQQLIIEYLENDDGWNNIKACICKAVKRNVTPQEMDDYIGVANIALVKAAKRFNSNRNMKFSSFVIMNVQSSIKTYLTYENRECRKGNKEVRSYDEVDEDGVSLRELLSDGKEVEVGGHKNIDMYLNSLSQDARKVLALLLQGYKLSKLREKTGFSTQYLRQLLLQLQNEERISLLKYEQRTMKGRRKNEKNWNL